MARLIPHPSPPSIPMTRGVLDPPLWSIPKLKHLPTVTPLHVFNIYEAASVPLGNNYECGHINANEGR